MKIPNRLDPLTIAARADGIVDAQSGGVVPPFQPSTTFVRDSNNQLLNGDNCYARDNNDVTRLAENIISKLEGAQESLLFPSGMAAIAALMRTVKNRGRNGGAIILQSGIYWGTTKWMREFCERRGITLIEMDCSNPSELDDKIISAKPDIVFVETPSNPWLKIVDIKRAAATCKKYGTLLAVDSTAATPILSQPLSMGADIVMHSATKAINGHSDVLAGLLSAADKTLPRWLDIKTDRHDAGAIIGSFESWLLVRGMRTLPLRISRMCENALQIATHLSDHKNVETVLYPGLVSHTGHALASRQMAGGYGHLLSVLVKGDLGGTLKVCGALNLIHRATSLGGVESLVEHRQTIEGTETGIPSNLLRISIGIEFVDDLIGDLDQALSELD